MKQQVSLEIMEFVERQILPRYNAFGESHGLRHVTRVIKNSLRLADVTGADIDMVYVIAAYHDLGMEGPRAIHHLTSGKILMADARLKKWFNADQLKVMKEAVEDHRASSSRQPRSIYGKIVAEADRDIDVHEISCVLSNMARRMIRIKLSRNNGNALHSTWTRNTPTMVISNCGFPILPMRRP